MVELLRILPAIFGMASLASGTKITLVRVLCLMALAAAARRLAMKLTLLVTFFARQRRVQSLQFEIRMPVRECIRIQLNDIGVPALMLGMT